MEGERLHLCGEYVLDTARGCLLRAGRPVHLRPQSYEVLRCLAEQRGRLVSKDRLIEEVWRGRAVTDGSLGKCIEEVRAALGAEAADYVRTVRGRGYIFDPDDGGRERGGGGTALTERVDLVRVVVEEDEEAGGAGEPASSHALSSVGSAVGFTPGEVRAAPAPLGVARAVGKSKHTRAFVLAALAFTAAGLAYFTFFTDRGRPISSVAVLPLANAGGDPELEYLSDGISNNIIERLSQLPGLKVMAHTAVFHYKGRQPDPRVIGRELDVAAVLTGRLVKRNDTLTINLELVDARDNSHIWGEQYDRRLSDLLAVQREIPVDIAEKLRLRLSGESKERLTRAYTENTEAYQLYLKGRYSWEKWTLDGAKQAVGYFEEAIRKDPNYALAYAGLADVYLFGTGAGAGLPQKEAHRRGREAATKALSLDPELGEAHAALAGALLYDDWDFAGAERGYKRAIELSPSYAEAYHQYSHLLLLLGRINESFAESQKFLELDPVSESPVGHLGYHFLSARQYDETIQQYQKDLQLYPDATHGSPRFNLGNAYYEKGMFREAVEEYLIGFAQVGFPPDKITELRKAFAKSGIKGFLQKLLEQYKAGPQTEWAHVSIAEIYARLGEKDQAFDHLEKAYAERSDGLLRLKEEIGFDNLRSDPRFAGLLRRIGLPQ